MKKILIVDDSASMRRMVKASLRNLAGVSFEEAENGLEAIERLSIGPIDLMTLDMNMPDIHGLEVLQFVCKHQSLKKIPVIVLTTRTDDDTREAVMNMGAAMYVNKPFLPRELMEHVGKLLEKAV